MRGRTLHTHTTTPLFSLDNTHKNTQTDVPDTPKGSVAGSSRGSFGPFEPNSISNNSRQLHRMARILLHNQEQLRVLRKRSRIAPGALLHTHWVATL